MELLVPQWPGGAFMTGYGSYGTTLLTSRVILSPVMIAKLVLECIYCSKLRCGALKAAAVWQFNVWGSQMCPINVLQACFMDLPTTYWEKQQSYKCFWAYFLHSCPAAKLCCVELSPSVRGLSWKQSTLEPQQMRHWSITNWNKAREQVLAKAVDTLGPKHWHCAGSGRSSCLKFHFISFPFITASLTVETVVSLSRFEKCMKISCSTGFCLYGFSGFPGDGAFTDSP